MIYLHRTQWFCAHLDQEEGDVERLQPRLQLPQAPQHEAELPRARVQVLRHLTRVCMNVLISVDEQLNSGASSLETPCTNLGSLWKTMSMGCKLAGFVERCALRDAGSQRGRMAALRHTRLKATATGAPLWAASSAVCSSAQLSRARWSRDILMMCRAGCQPGSITRGGMRCL